MHRMEHSTHRTQVSESPSVDEIKVGYTRLDGSDSKAYVNEATLVGIDKYTDEDVRLEWAAGSGYVVARGGVS